MIFRIPNVYDHLIVHPVGRGLFFTCLTIVVAFGIIYIRIAGTLEDYWQHLAAFRAISYSPLDPATLYFDKPYEVHLFTPYHVVWGAIMWAGGLDVWTVATLAALTNFALFLLGCHLAARFLIGDYRLDMILCAALLFLWGNPIWSSGVYSFGQITLQAVYPSFFCLALTMIAIALIFEERFRTIGWQIALLITVAVVFVSHPITASVLLTLIGAKALTTQNAGLTDKARIAIICAAGVGLGLLWPYFSMITLVSSVQQNTDSFGQTDLFYKNIPEQFGASIVGIVALRFLRSSRTIQFLTISLMVFASIYAFNYYSYVSTVMSRYLIYTALTLQLLSIMALLHYQKLEHSKLVSIFFVALLSMAAITQINLSTSNNYGPYWDFTTQSPLGTHSPRNSYRDLTDFAETVPKSNLVAMTPQEFGYVISATTGLKVVSVRHSAPTMPNPQARAADTDRFFNRSSSCTDRVQIANRWQVDLVILETGHWMAQPAQTCGSKAIFKGDTITVLAIDRH